MVETSFKIIFVGLWFVYILIRVPFERKHKQTEKIKTMNSISEKYLLLLLFVGLILIPFLWSFTSFLDDLDIKLPVWTRLLGVAISILSLFYFWWIHKTLGANWSPTLEIRKGHKLIKIGPYQRVRHPMYAQIWLWTIAQVLVVSNLLAGFSGIITWAILYFSRVLKEEKMMVENFGSEYIEYMKQTGRVFPKFGIGPAGSIISSINDLSNWLIAQMNGGKFNQKQVIPSSIIRETMQPASLIASVPDKCFENLNSIYGMGRGTSSYKGHYRTQHGGAIGGIYSQISFMPADSVGIIVFVNGGVGNLPGIISNVLYDKLLDLGETPWSDRALKDYLKNKATEKETRKKTDVDRVSGTKPSHPLTDYVGKYEDAAYGVMEIQQQAGELRFIFNNATLPLQHYHYDRFVSPDDEIVGKWSLIFSNDAQGSIQNVRVSLDEKEVIFVKKADAQLSDPAFLKKLVGQYELNGSTLNLVVNNKELVITSAPPQHLEPYRGKTFRIREFSDQIIEFNFDNAGSPTGLKLTYDGKAVVFTKKK